MSENERPQWLVRFLNEPVEEQVRFLFRDGLEESIRKEIEEKIFGGKIKPTE